MNKWYETPMGGDGEKAIVVIEAKCHDPSAWKLRITEAASIAVSDATAQILARVQASLEIIMDAEDSSYIHTVDFSFIVGSERAEQFRKLLEQPLKTWTDKRAQREMTLWYTNAYRAISCESISENRFRIVTRLALGEWKEGKHGKKHALDCIPVTTGLQRIIQYAAEDILESVPQKLRTGVCQQVAQDVSSYVGQLESSRVKGDVAFPSTEDRNPERRRQSYERAIDALVNDLEPIARMRKRDAMPGEFADDDLEGDRTIIRDYRWDAVMLSPEPRAIPLFFVGGGDIRLVEGSASFDAGTSKRNRHRGSHVLSDRVRADRPEKVRTRGTSGMRQWYAAIPIGTQDRPSSTTGRGLDLNMHLAPIQGGKAFHAKSEEILFPLSADENRFFRVLRRTDVEIAWSKMIRKHGEWFVQLTLRMNPSAVQPTNRVLGVSFGIDAVATWELIEENEDRSVVVHEGGTLGPNQQILAFLAEKRQVEWDQAKGRWVGGQQFAKQLEGIAHQVVNQLIALAKTHGAVLALEEISYVQKCGADHERNMLFSAWNFGQLSRIAEYKSELASVGVLLISDYVTNLTCPECGAIGKTKDTPDKAATRKRNEDGVLECRKCGRAALVTPEDRAMRAALHGLDILIERRKRANKKVG